MVRRSSRTGLKKGGLFCLDLGHGRPTFSDSVATEIDAARTGCHGGEEAGGGVGGEGEPKECGCGLGFVTPFGFVVCAVGDVVVIDVVLENGYTV